MIKNKSFLWLLVLFVCQSLFAQPNPIQITISATYGSKMLNLADSAFHTNDTHHIQIMVLKFYISNIQFLQKGKVVLQEKNSFHLVDLEAKSTKVILLKNENKMAFDELRFNLGIDSTTNVSGAMGGDLDPTKGMYWTWQSGYINFKLEGSSPICNTRNNEFQFHLGGYKKPHYCLQMISLPVQKTQNIQLNLDIQKILSPIDLTILNQIMSPSEEAVSMSIMAANAFTILEN
ncbi:MAG: MbnP family protein [Saprospiraceae bacterium]